MCLKPGGGGGVNPKLKGGESAYERSGDIYIYCLCFTMVSFKGQKKLEPRPDWSPLGVQFKISDEYPHPFYMRSLPRGLKFEPSFSFNTFFLLFHLICHTLGFYSQTQKLSTSTDITNSTKEMYFPKVLN